MLESILWSYLNDFYDYVQSEEPITHPKFVSGLEVSALKQNVEYFCDEAGQMIQCKKRYDQIAKVALNTEGQNSLQEEFQQLEACLVEFGKNVYPFLKYFHHIIFDVKMYKDMSLPLNNDQVRSIQGAYEDFVSVYHEYEQASKVMNREERMVQFHEKIWDYIRLLHQIFSEL